MAVALFIAALASGVAAQGLIDVRQAWPYTGPARVDTATGARGQMQGYNRVRLPAFDLADEQCNATTANQQSHCVNTVVNTIRDFCLYAPPEPNSTIGMTEGEAVAYCVDGSKYGTRTIPSGAITGLLVVKTPSYVAIAANLNGQLLNIQANDEGGEMDPHGADLRGKRVVTCLGIADRRSPIGSLMWSDQFGASNASLSQVIEWHEFIGERCACDRRDSADASQVHVVRMCRPGLR